MIALGVLLSGNGSNFQAIIDAIAAGELDARVAVVVSNVASARGLDRARDAGIPAIVVDHRGFASRADFDAHVAKLLVAHGAEYVVLAGFMRVVTGALLGAFPMRVINIHPSLLPAFPGIDAQSQAFAYGARIAGCTVHFVDEGTDTGPVIAQCAVGVLASDDDASLRARILHEEHKLLTRTLQWLSEGRVTVEPRDPPRRARVTVAGAQTFSFAATPQNT